MAFFYYVILAIMLVVMVGMLIWFLLLLKEPIIAARGWQFSLVLAIVGMIHFAILTIELGVTVNSGLELTCNFLLWASVLFVPMFYLPFFFRSFHLLFQHRQQIEKGNFRFGWYTRNRLWASLRLNFLLYFLFALFFLIIALIIQYSTPSPYPFITTNDCLSKQIYLVIVEVVVIVVIMVWLVVQLWNVSDAFYIKTELKFGLSVCIPPAILWGLFMSAKKLFPSYYKSSWFAMAAIFAGYITAIGYPIAAVFFKRWKYGPSNLIRVSSHNSIFDVDQLKTCVKDPTLFEILKLRCQRAWCVENLLFFKAVIEFSEMYPSSEPHVRKQAAAEINQTFIICNSDLEINIDVLVRESIFETLNSNPNDVSPTIFDEAFKTISDMLKFGVFREWSLTPEFRNYFPSRRISTSGPSSTKLSQVNIELND